MATFPKPNYRFSAILARLFAEIDKLIFKFIWKFKGPRTAKILLKKNKVAGHTHTQISMTVSFNETHENTMGQLKAIPTKDFAVFSMVEETLGELCEVPRCLL